MKYLWLIVAVIGCGWASACFSDEGTWQVVDDFDRPDMLYHGDAWESLNPGYWQIENGTLRRRLKNVGNQNPITNFPFHWSNGGKTIEPRKRERLPNLPPSMLWNRRWRLKGNYSVRARIRILDLDPPGRGERGGYVGICFGGETPYESRSWRAAPGARSWMAIWTKEGQFGLFDHLPKALPLSEESVRPAAPVAAGDVVTVTVTVSGGDPRRATVEATMRRGDETITVRRRGVPRERFTDGLFGLACYGSLDFAVEQVELAPLANQQLGERLNELQVCYPLGDTLRQIDGQWTCKFVAIFRNPGDEVAVRVADREQPEQGWEQVAVAGRSAIIDDWWRRYVAVIDVKLPESPGETTLYYTVWKDGADVTGDPRPAAPEQGYLGPQRYVGRLPKLAAPYRVCTLGGHALIGGGTTLPRARTYEQNWVHGQPTEGAYRYFEDYGFQIINWDDDVWYMELMFPPPSTDDAWKIVTLTIANPTTRWQMMRHWNVINPGDHDYGMDDIKGPEQLLVRRYDDLGQDPAYLHRNYSINHLLTQGRTTPITTENPKDWRRWKMPQGDFSLLVLEARNWRTSQDTSLWRERGWDHPGAYDRSDPTRTLLGEEQFAWLQNILATDTSPLMLVSGVNCMHPVFGGQLTDPKTGLRFFQDDRVAADYAGWCKAGTDRLLNLLGGRPGLLSVYGDIHLACVVENRRHRVIESSCGPIGRGGSRRLKEDWAPEMKDYDGRSVKIHALYHAQYQTPDLQPRQGPPHWNFLELQFDPRGREPTMDLKIRNIIDAPTAQPRGGGVIHRTAQSTGRPATCRLATVHALPNADVRFMTRDGRPICGTRSLPDGTIPLAGLVDIEPGTVVVMTADDGKTVDAQLVKTSTPKNEE